MKSFSLLRTNVALTTNVKLVVSSDHSLTLDSIESLPDLNITRLKKFNINKDNLYEFVLPSFWKNIPNQIAYHIKNDGDSDIMFDDFTKQYDSIYYSGGRNISENKDYTEEFEYFAPLHVGKGNIPSNFIIFRVDGPGLMKLNKDNFRSEIVDNLKCVKVFDLTKKTDLGQFLDKSINQNKNFPHSSVEIDFSELYSTISGIKFPSSDTDTGYIQESFSIDFSNELSFYDLQKFITSKFKDNGVIYPYILNFSFLFDDTPATPTSLRKWSLNRYMGFYFDSLILEQTVTPTKLPKLKDDVYILDNNFIESLSSGFPFQETNDFDPNLLFVQINGTIYKIKEVLEFGNPEYVKTRNNQNSFEDQVQKTIIRKYKIISDISLVGQDIGSDSSLNQIIIKYENGENKLLKVDGTPLFISDFDEIDIWMIEINGEYFKLRKNSDGVICLFTDYAFEQSESKIDYYINDPDLKYRKSIDILISNTKEPIKFNIYKAKFTDVKDFDNEIVSTNFAKFEYEKDDQLTLTDESKLYVDNIITGGIDDFKFGSDVVYIPVSSEYTSNNETFRIMDDDSLTPLWSKNPDFIKWGYQNSICSNNYSYLLNNSLVADPFNSSTNFIDKVPSRVQKNLDYFYSLNSDNVDYLHHSLHIEDQENGVLNQNFKFEIDKYLGLSYSLDYFSYFFSKKSVFNSGKLIESIRRWSYFNGDDYDTNSTLFKGMKFLIKSVNDASDLKNIITSNTQEFTDYKFSILLSNNDYSVSPDPSDLNKTRITKTKNTLRWNVIEQWVPNKTYATASLVLWNDIIFESKNTNTLAAPNNPGNNSTSWDIYTTTQTIYWDGGVSTEFDGYPYFRRVVYNSGLYYQLNESGQIDFWNPRIQYAKDIVVIFKANFYKSLQNLNIKAPTDTNFWEIITINTLVDKLNFQSQSLWKVVPEWSSASSYNSELNNSGVARQTFDPNQISFSSVTFNNVLYGTTQSISSNITDPSADTRWTRMHSFVAETSYIYGPSASTNNVLSLNGEIYLCKDNSSPADPGDFQIDKTLDDGVNIYINKKFKNVLINIYVNDNTFASAISQIGEWIVTNNKISNVNRDNLYNKLLYKLTAANLFELLNNPTKKQDFSDKLRYIIINEDLTSNIYDFNDEISAKKLPYIILPQYAQELKLRVGQISPEALVIDQNILKPTKFLLDGLVTTKSTINYYSDLPIANKLKYMSSKLPYVSLYRYSGNYSPIFKDIQLFNNDEIDKNFANYKFDTNLTNFGISTQLVVSKVNRFGSILKLKNSDRIRSVYPMLDEFGYHTVNRFIFKSNWDFEYHYECVIPGDTNQNNDEKILTLRKQ